MVVVVRGAGFDRVVRMGVYELRGGRREYDVVYTTMYIILYIISYHIVLYQVRKKDNGANGVGAS